MDPSGLQDDDAREEEKRHRGDHSSEVTAIFLGLAAASGADDHQQTTSGRPPLENQPLHTSILNLWQQRDIQPIPLQLLTEYQLGYLPQSTIGLSSMATAALRGIPDHSNLGEALTQFRPAPQFTFPLLNSSTTAQQSVQDQFHLTTTSPQESTIQLYPSQESSMAIRQSPDQTNRVHGPGLDNLTGHPQETSSHQVRGFSEQKPSMREKLEESVAKSGDSITQPADRKLTSRDFRQRHRQLLMFHKQQQRRVQKQMQLTSKKWMQSGETFVTEKEKKCCFPMPQLIQHTHSASLQEAIPARRKHTINSRSMAKYRQRWELLCHRGAASISIHNVPSFAAEMFRRSLFEDRNRTADRFYRKIHRLPSPHHFISRGTVSLPSLSSDRASVAPTSSNEDDRETSTK